MSEVRHPIQPWEWDERTLAIELDTPAQPELWVELICPVPPSKNNIYRFVGRRPKLSLEARTYKREFARVMMGFNRRLLGAKTNRWLFRARGLYKVEMTFYLEGMLRASSSDELDDQHPLVRRDQHNLPVFFLDCLQEFLGWDDRAAVDTTSRLRPAIHHPEPWTYPSIDIIPQAGALRELAVVLVSRIA